MGYAKRNIKPQAKKSQTGVLVAVFILMVIALVAVALSLPLRISTNTQLKATVANDADVETAEEDTLHITQFLGYEFGKVYSSYSDIVHGTWFGFLMVYHNSDEPLSRLRFTKDAYDFNAKENIAELVAVFEKKYGIKMSVGGTYAFYHGKHTTIRIDFSRNKRDDMKGTVDLEITDVKLRDENHKKLIEEIRRKQAEDMERM